MNASTQCDFFLIYPNDDEAHVCQLEQWHDGDHVCVCGTHFTFSVSLGSDE